jgi:hypothetical protein
MKYAATAAGTAARKTSRTSAGRKPDAGREDAHRAEYQHDEPGG